MARTEITRAQLSARCGMDTDRPTDVTEEAVRPSLVHGPATCRRGHGIEHCLTKSNHPWTNGQAERMNRMIKEATIKRFLDDSHEQLKDPPQ